MERRSSLYYFSVILVLVQCYLRVIYMLTFGTLAQAMGPLDQLAGPFGGVLFPCYRTCYFCVISLLCPCAVRVMSVLF